MGNCPVGGGVGLVSSAEAFGLEGVDDGSANEERWTEPTLPGDGVELLEEVDVDVNASLRSRVHGNHRAVGSCTEPCSFIGSVTLSVVLDERPYLRRS